MCRLLGIKSEKPFAISTYLKTFAEIARSSKEYQGHGWGYALYKDGSRRLHHSALPIWEDNLEIPEYATLLLVHARSAFLNAGLTVDNNMPFYDEQHVFLFNGELNGVRIKEEGRIGAEKLFNFIKRFDRGCMNAALSMSMQQLQKRTSYIKAANIMISDGSRLYIASLFNENEDYYTLYRNISNETLFVCSEPFPTEQNWEPIPQGIHQVSE